MKEGLHGQVTHPATQEQSRFSTNHQFTGSTVTPQRTRPHRRQRQRHLGSANSRPLPAPHGRDKFTGTGYLPPPAAQIGSSATVRTTRDRRSGIKPPAEVKVNANKRFSAPTFPVSRLASAARRPRLFHRPPLPPSTRSGRVSSPAARRDPSNPPPASASLRSCASVRIARDRGRRPSRQKRHLPARLRPRNIAPATG